MLNLRNSKVGLLIAFHDAGNKMNLAIRLCRTRVANESKVKQKKKVFIIYGGSGIQLTYLCRCLPIEEVSRKIKIGEKRRKSARNIKSRMI